ncbi:MAG: hypothetical protein NZ480_09540, partial [Bdellovibrionaceae bacterium]|nr:hypothetical protein [Pseudobdellovibrionaceae bacterium]MDW8190710.1 hypothetical protein [Pseudobdellovibrionaceae bacterium]
MFFFCVTFPQIIPSSQCDTFYSITPNLYYRPPRTILGDIRKVLKLHGSLKNIHNKLQELWTCSLQIGWGISPHHAELSCYYPNQSLAQIPVNGLKHFEGLDPWPCHSSIDECIADLQELGYQSIYDLYRYPLNLQDCQKRWQNTGHSLYQKLFNPHYKNIIPCYEPIPQKWSNHRYFEYTIYDPSYLITAVMDLLNETLETIRKIQKVTDQITVTFFLDFISHQISKTFFSLKPQSDFFQWKKIIEPLLSNHLTQALDEHNHLGVDHIEITAQLKSQE